MLKKILNILTLNCLSKATECSKLKNILISHWIVNDYHDNRRDDAKLRANQILEFLIIVICSNIAIIGP